jgi:hypothetical protein
MLVAAVNEKYGTYCDKLQFPIYEKWFNFLVFALF